MVLKQTVLQHAVLQHAVLQHAVLQHRHRAVASLVVAGSWAAAALVAAFVAVPPAGAQSPSAGEVALPLADYLALRERVAQADDERQRRAKKETPSLAFADQRTTLDVVADAGDAALATVRLRVDLDVQAVGRPTKTLRLPGAGFLDAAELAGADGRPTTGAALAVEGNERSLVALEPGSYRVRLSGRLPMTRSGGVQRVELPPVVAPVALFELALPTGFEWTCAPAVIVDERVDGDRRRVKLTAPLGSRPVLELRRRVAGSEADQLLAKAVVATVVQLRPEGWRRHEVVLYEVARGGLDSFVLRLPPGLDVLEAATDEGPAVVAPAGDRLEIHRRSRLRQTGYVVLSSPVQDGGGQVDLGAVVPEIDVRARYLAVAGVVAADAAPELAASWGRADLDDLPPALRDALGAGDLVAAWRLAPGAAPGTLKLAPLPAAPLLDSVVRRRDSTTLMTVDGTLLHRDTLTLSPVASTFQVELPQGATLWSARVDGQGVRPIERDGRLTVPLPLAVSGESTLEIVAVLERAIPPGRSVLELELPRLKVPVLDHRWLLLLPEGARYRYRAGALHRAPAPGLPGDGGYLGMVEETIAVTSEAPMIDQRASDASEVKGGRLLRDEDLQKKRVGAEAAADLESAFTYQQNVAGLRQGLAGGVKPLPVTIPETGKALWLAGVLPPPVVGVTLEGGIL